MRALRFHQFGPPAEVLRLEDLPVPEPDAGQVRIRLTHRPIHPSDLLTIAGQYGHLPKLPATPGVEGMGCIDALGPGVVGFQPGDRVIPLRGGGTWREYVVSNTFGLLPIPETVSDQAASQFVVNPVTAWVMLEEELDLEAGDWLLQTAAASALGRLVIGMAPLRGYRTVNLVRRQEQAEELLRMGADVALTIDTPDLVETVRRVTGGGAAAALDAVGGHVGALALKCLRPGSTMLVYGLLSGETTPVHNGEMLFRGLTVRGFWLSHWFRVTPPERVGAVLMSLMRQMEEGRLLPDAEAEYDLADFQPAIAHAERSGRHGKILLTG